MARGRWRAAVPLAPAAMLGREIAGRPVGIVVQGEQAVARQRRIRGSGAEGAVEGRKALGDLSPRDQGLRQVVPGIDMARRQPRRLPVVLQRIGEAVAGLEVAGEVVVRLGMARVEGDRPALGRDRPVPVAREAERQAEIDQQVRRRPDRGRPPQQPGRRCRMTRLQGDDRQPVQGASARRPAWRAASAWRRSARRSSGACDAGGRRPRFTRGP